MTNSTLKEFFESLKEESHIRALVDESREEDLYLEFKEKQDRSSGDLSDKDKEGVSKALSGFANADGGILLFGVETKKCANAPDRATKLKAITNASRFQARLKDSIMNCTQPVVDDVAIGLVPAGDGSDAGYVKCLIPASDKVPHRAMLAQREYFRRTSNGFRRLDHFELEDLFGRRPRPDLRFGLQLIQDAASPQEVVRFTLLNVGRGIARYVGFLCEFKDADTRVTHVSGFGLTNESTVNKGRAVVVFDDNKSILHANGITTHVGQAVIVRKEGMGKPLAVSVKWYCENMAVRSKDLELPPEMEE